MLESAKKVITKDVDGKVNGYLIELTKDGKLTSSYLSCCYPGAFKGYHLHKVREANYVCIRGRLKVIMYTPVGRKEVILDASSPERLHIPANVPTGLLNEGTEEAWIVNNPSPAYDPDFKDEQVDFTEEQLNAMLRMYEDYLPQLVADKLQMIPNTFETGPNGILIGLGDCVGDTFRWGDAGTLILDGYSAGFKLTLTDDKLPR